jgi:hypothetical protein
VVVVVVVGPRFGKGPDRDAEGGRDVKRPSRA